MKSSSQEYIVTQEGKEALHYSKELEEAVQAFWQHESPEKAIGGKPIGTGRYSSVREIGGIALKVTSTTSSEDTYNSGEKIPAENLVAQFRFLTALRNHMATRDPSIVVPKQLFVMRSEHNAYLLGQEYMKGWEPYDTWAMKAFSFEGEATFRDFSRTIKDRLLNAVGGNAIRHGMNDLHMNPDSIHGGNVLVPHDAKPSLAIPLCIIDQPRLTQRSYQANIV